MVEAICCRPLEHLISYQWLTIVLWKQIKYHLFCIKGPRSRIIYSMSFNIFLSLLLLFSDLCSMTKQRNQNLFNETNHMPRDQNLFNDIFHTAGKSCLCYFAFWMISNNRIWKNWQRERSCHYPRNVVLAIHYIWL